jgi:acetyl-CoA synthetase
LRASWATRRRCVVYGPLAHGVAVLMYEGAPSHPEPDRFWGIIDRHGVTVFDTVPTVIRAFMRWSDEFVNRHRQRSLRLLGAVGEPINPEAGMWYCRTIGRKRGPIVDLWRQTETGAFASLTASGLRPVGLRPVRERSCGVSSRRLPPAAA